MIRGKVIGSVVSTVKEEELRGIKLLAVQVLEDNIPGEVLIAADVIGVSGVGDYVYILKGKEAGLAISEERKIPIDYGIVGVINSYKETI